MRYCRPVLLAAVHLMSACAGRSAPSGVSSSGSHQAGAEHRPFALEGVTVVDVVNGRLLSDRTVVVADRHVRSVGRRSETRLSRGVAVVDARGHYLIPGLWTCMRM